MFAGSWVCPVLYQVGVLERSGNGSELLPECGLSVGELHQLREAENARIVSKLREDENAQVLFETCLEDARLGRMTKPGPLDKASYATCTFSPRFGVEQGETLVCKRDVKWPFCFLVQVPKLMAAPRFVPSMI